MSNPLALPANLPSIAHAKLPAIYINATNAIRECARVDECKDWANKAEALASYAKQSHDEDLHRMADRIQARAIKRCGELLREIAPSEGEEGRPKKGKGTLTLSRDKAAEDAGLSLHQKRTALRVANLPDEEFEEAVESEIPPTVTELAERGKKPAPKPSIEHLKGRDPEEFKASTYVQGSLRELSKLLDQSDPTVIVRGAYDHERPVMREHAMRIARWLDKLLGCIEKETAN